MQILGSPRCAGETGAVKYLLPHSWSQPRKLAADPQPLLDLIYPARPLFLLLYCSALNSLVFLGSVCSAAAFAETGLEFVRELRAI